MSRFTKIQRAAHVLLVAAAMSTAAMPSIARDVSSGQAGGGNCSIWQLIKGSMTGVYCGYL